MYTLHIQPPNRRDLPSFTPITYTDTQIPSTAVDKHQIGTQETEISEKRGLMSGKYIEYLRKTWGKDYIILKPFPCVQQALSSQFKVASV